MNPSPASCSGNECQAKYKHDKNSRNRSDLYNFGGGGDLSKCIAKQAGAGINAPVSLRQKNSFLLKYFLIFAIH